MNKGFFKIGLLKLVHGPLNLPGQKTRSKNFKTPFFQDIKNSFDWVADMGPEPHQN